MAFCFSNFIVIIYQQMSTFNFNITIKNNQISPPLFLAPMAGITHSAFRRLIADFGGYGALYTEMLSARSIPHDNIITSPFLKRRDHEGTVIYQLTLSGDEPVQPIIDVFNNIDVEYLDINLGCPAPLIKRQGAGKALFDNLNQLEKTLLLYREKWNKTLTVKCRLGDESEGWEERFCKRLELFEQCGIDAVCVHPRFSDDKLKRPARLKLFSWIRTLTKLPLIANGDIGPDECTTLLSSGDVNGVMIGRLAIIKPWVFKYISSGPQNIDHKEVWERMVKYTLEDFPAEKAIYRIKEFSQWYAKNFFFGHEFFRRTQSAPDLQTLKQRALEFLNSGPALENSAC
jgi:tRNA-dihydrouridine synthase